MDLLTVVLRLVHVVLGALWVGTAVFTAVFLAPAMQDAGPDAAKVMGALQRRGFMTVLPILAIATLVSGLWLYWRASAGFQAAYVTSPVGLGFGVGGTLAIVAYAFGMIVTRPAMLRSVALAQTLGTASDDERRKIAAEVQRLRARGTAGGRVVAVLLTAAVAAMAVARYL